ncbi:uncharacterized protein LOC141849151 [Brevipalpus obovatus]|uniref:uncharacterized protein LOC141849151 n=1 Tax=Brevipalpus obovatus TaxID=246614 RepID=UPI003D9F8948
MNIFSVFALCLVITTVAADPNVPQPQVPQIPYGYPMPMNYMPQGQFMQPGQQGSFGQPMLPYMPQNVPYMPNGQFMQPGQSMDQMAQMPQQRSDEVLPPRQYEQPAMTMTRDLEIQDPQQPAEVPQESQQQQQQQSSQETKKGLFGFSRLSGLSGLAKKAFKGVLDTSEKGIHFMQRKIGNNNEQGAPQQAQQQQVQQPAQVAPMAQ